MNARHGRVRHRGSRRQVDAMVDGRRVRLSAPPCEAVDALLKELLGSGAEQSAAGNRPTVTQIPRCYVDSTGPHCRPKIIRTSDATVKRLKAFFGDQVAAELARTDIDRFSAHPNGRRSWTARAAP